MRRQMHACGRASGVCCGAIQEWCRTRPFVALHPLLRAESVAAYSQEPVTRDLAHQLSFRRFNPMPSARFAKYASIVILASGLSAAAHAQRPVPVIERGPHPHTSAYVEAFGAGGLYSLNVERRSGSSGLLRAGVTSWSFDNYDGITNSERAVIGSIGKVFMVQPPGAPRETPLELGVGLVLGSQSRHQSGNNPDSGLYSAAIGSLGLRSDRTDPGFIWRLTFVPFYTFTTHNDFSKKGFEPGIGVSFGKIF